MNLQKTLIIAEAGVNHNGDILIAKQLVDVAVKAGADFVKFQTFNVDSLVSHDAPKAAYQLSHGCEHETQSNMLNRLRLSEENHYELNDYCFSKKIGFLSTAFDVESLSFLAGFDLPFIKIPSGEITNLPYLRCVGRLAKKIILSTGMATIEEIFDAIKALVSSGACRDSITLLHCTTEYPAPLNEVNLRAIQTMRETFKMPVGYSDHTLGIEVPIAAVAMGATVIEKHFTLNRELVGPDHKASLEPSELIEMVKAIRNIELAMGGGEKKPTLCEKKNLLIVRKSLVASKPIKIGDYFSSDNVVCKRPGTGISPMFIDNVLGRIATKNYDVDDLIDL